MTSVGLVVARYKEDLSWINDAQQQNPTMNIYIYNKYPSPIESVVGPYRYEYRGGIGGNEAETYLYHMLWMHDQAWLEADHVTLFVQGRPFDHVHQEQLYRILRNPTTVIDFEWLAYHRLDCKVANECHHGGLPIAPFYKDLMGVDISPDFNFGVGGMFAVTRDIVLRRSKAHLARTRAMILDQYKDNEPWCILERTWDQVLGVPKP